MRVPASASGEFRLTPGRGTAGPGSSPDRRAGSGGGHPAADPPSRAVPWSYEGDTGPEHWGQLAGDFELCAKGRRQSPIDIRDGFAVDLEPVAFDYRPGGFTVVNTGRTLEVAFPAGSRIELGGRVFELLQLHFHHPAEGSIDGRSADMSAHLVHRDAEGRLAIVALQLLRGAEHASIQQIWNHLPLEAGEPVRARATLDPLHLVPADRRYVTFMGSLTTPPCTEGVQWIVLQQPVELSDEQVAFFARLFPMNARPVQAAAGRVIKRSR